MGEHVGYCTKIVKCGVNNESYIEYERLIKCLRRHTDDWVCVCVSNGTTRSWYRDQRVLDQAQISSITHHHQFRIVEIPSDISYNLTIGYFRPNYAWMCLKMFSHSFAQRCVCMRMYVLLMVWLHFSTWLSMSASNWFHITNFSAPKNHLWSNEYWPAKYHWKPEKTTFDTDNFHSQSKWWFNAVELLTHLKDTMEYDDRLNKSLFYSLSFPLCFLCCLNPLSWNFQQPTDYDIRYDRLEL